MEIEQVIAWATEKRKVSELIAHDKNPRKISEKQIEDLKKSFLKFNLVEIPAINKDNTILAGHQRLKIMQMIGRGEEVIDVRVPSRLLTKKEAEEYLVRSNVNTGEWDLNILVKEFASEDLSAWGFSDQDINIFDEKKSIEEETEPTPELPVKARAKAGMLFTFPGGHRLLCADATDAGAVQFLMDGKKAQMFYTDPPYNVDYNYFGYDERGKTLENGKKIFNDKKTPQEYENFLVKIFKNAYEATDQESTFYCWHASRFEYVVREAMLKTEWHPSQNLIWLKDRLHLSPGQDYHRIYEPCVYGWKKGFSHRVMKKITGKFDELIMIDKMDFEDLLDVIYSKRDAQNEYVHPTQKPTKIASKPLRKSSIEGNIILDFFAGSGSTLIACHQMKRQAYCCELDPKYCDVIITRYCNLTGTDLEEIYANAQLISNS